MVRDFIRSLGGPTKLAAELTSMGYRVTALNTQVWCDRDRIPEKWCSKVARVALRHGVKKMPKEIREVTEWFGVDRASSSAE